MKLFWLILVVPGIAFAEANRDVQSVKEFEDKQVLQQSLSRLSENLLPFAGGDRLFYRDIKNQRIGIGTTTPTTDLDVNGGIRATGATIGFWKHVNTQVYSGASSTSYTDLDLSATIGANRALVILKVTGNLDNLACRENGDATDYFSTSGFASVNRGHSVTGTGSQIMCATDANGVIEWRVQTTNTATIVLVGYIR